MFSFFDLRTGKICDIPKDGGLSCALGNFDGVHIGHRAIIRNAASFGLPVCVFTFASNPFGSPVITPPEEKLRLFALYGADYAAVFDFEKLKDTEAESFADDILVGTFGCRAASCGYNYRFGRGAKGTPALLTQLLGRAGAETVTADRVIYEGEGVSSSRIRTCLSEGDTESARGMLGRPFSLSLPVVHGNEIGRTLGFPTANFSIPAEYAAPANGVYITSCSGKPCVTNIGRRPTVTDAADVVCETHIIGDDRDLYGEILKVSFFRKLRDEVRFKDENELVSQLKKDCRASLDYFG